MNRSGGDLDSSLAHACGPHLDDAPSAPSSPSLGGRAAPTDAAEGGKPTAPVDGQAARAGEGRRGEVPYGGLVGYSPVAYGGDECFLRRRKSPCYPGLKPL